MRQERILLGALTVFKAKGLEGALKSQSQKDISSSYQSFMRSIKQVS